MTFAEHWPQSTIFAFEPVPKFFESLERNVMYFNSKYLYNNIKLYPCGLFTTSGKRTFYYSTSCGGASSFLPDNHDKIVGSYNDMPITVKCKNLDEWAQEEKISHIDFMWLDMEGGELYMLKTSPNILKTVRVILTEMNFREFRKGSTQATDLCDFLEENNFILHKIWGSPIWQGTGLFIKKDLVDNIQKNIPQKEE